MSLLPSLLLISLLAPQGPGEPERHINRTGAFAFVLPDGWRQVTPDEALQLSREPTSLVPADLLSPRQVAFYPYGAIDRWLGGAFDGRCLTIQQLDGEYPVDQEGISVIRAASSLPGEGGWRREVLSAELVELGKGEHQTIQCTVRDQAQGSRTIKSLVLFVPTGGDTLVLSFRAWEDDYENALPEFHRVSASMTFSRPARGPTDLGDRLLYPALIGALVGLLLLGLRRRPAAPA